MSAYDKDEGTGCSKREGRSDLVRKSYQCGGGRSGFKRGEEVERVNLDNYFWKFGYVEKA